MLTAVSGVIAHSVSDNCCMKFVAYILGLLIAFVAVRYAMREAFRSLVTSVTTDKAATCLVMLGNTTREEEKFTYIVGSIKNNCDQKFGQVTIAFKLDRSSGSTLSLPEAINPYGSRVQSGQTQKFKPGSTIDLPEALVFAYSRDVKPFETRNFKTAMHVSANSTYRFDGIKAF